MTVMIVKMLLLSAGANIKYFVFFVHMICSECLGIHMDGLQFNPTLEMSTIRLQWTTCNAWEMRPLSLIALMSLSMIARGVKGQE